MTFSLRWKHVASIPLMWLCPVLNVMRKATGILTGASITSSEIEFPLTMGRDFTGIVLSKGHGVGNRLEQGDQVWGVIPVHQQGCHSECVVVDSDLINRRPENVSYLEGASILYAGLTAWSALWLTGGLCYKINLAAYRNKRVLLLGGSGGVGTQAIQLLKAWNMHVVTTCSSDAITLLEKMGADIIIDYKCDGADQLIKSEGPYDIILDCANQGPDLIKVKGYPHSTYITLNSPMLKNIDKYGLFGGGIKNIVDILKYNIYEPQKIGSVKWGFFVPSRTGLNMLQTLVESGKVKPVVMEVYAFKDLPKAYERIARGHLRGKLVIDLKQGS
ncbi:reticulon-4-interacting protein 1 homolog, mitochondrial isoform X2 [Orussus abietinus]|uniref:reticulon-4-interacting protein 1 homolog, mitochondrial isoform X2 n=1 Tax=Orussus abietinus TaxID=222816 RepID=UPI000C715FD9|nr:reticulon-4-interacting protein 1 homolog, mitochondrial isoform X2 [Orussus abietinus]